MEKIRTTVRVAGKEYTMSSYDSEEYVHRVAIYVDRKMTELGMATQLPTGTLAVLTALTVADDLLKAHDENSRLRKELAGVRQELNLLQKQTGVIQEG